MATIQNNTADQNPILRVQGDFSIIRIKEDPTQVWLLDNNSKTVQRFSTPAAVKNFAPAQGNDIAYFDAAGAVATVPFNWLTFYGYNVLDDTNRIQADGTDPLHVQKVTIKSAELVPKYGKPEANNTSAYNIVNGLYDLAEKSGIASGDTVKKLKSGANLGVHVGALEYGGYGIPDIMRDIKRLDLVNRGDASAANISVISTTEDKATFGKSTTYGAAIANPKLQLPSSIGNWTMDELSYTLKSMPDELFQNLVPALDPSSPEFKEQMEKVNTLFMDSATEQLEADTDQAHQVAKTNWDEARNYLEKYYRIRLSSDVLTAWDQIQKLTETMASRGLAGTGMEREAQDIAERRAAENAEYVRSTGANEAEKTRAAYYTEKATPEEIRNDLTDEEKQKWGLIPTEEERQFYTLENLKKLNPAATDEELQSLIDSEYDTSDGSLLRRSTLYKNLASGKYTNLRNKIEAQKTEVLKKADEAAKKKLDTLTGSDPFAQGEPDDPTLPTGQTGPANPAPASPKWGDELKVNGQRISFADPNYAEYASQVGVAKPTTIGASSFTSLTPASQSTPSGTPSDIPVQGAQITTPTAYNPTTSSKKDILAAALKAKKATVQTPVPAPVLPTKKKASSTYIPPNPISGGGYF